MNIKWNEVTWYSKLLAVVVFIAVFMIAFHLGMKYEEVKNLKDEATSVVPTPEPAVNDTVKISDPAGTSALFLQAPDKDQNEKGVSLVLLDSKDGTLKTQSNFSISDWSSSYVVYHDGGKLYFITSENLVARYDIKTGETDIIPIQNLSNAKTSSWTIQDLAVYGDTLVYLALGSYVESGELAGYAPCVIRSSNMNTGLEEDVLFIPQCNAPHGPYYSIHAMTSDGGSVILFEDYGEAAVAATNVHIVNLSSKVDAVTEKLVYSGYCEPGMFYEPEYCTPQVEQENKIYKQFQNTYSVGFGWETSCGSIKVKKDDESHLTYRVDAAGKSLTMEYSTYIGCLK